MNDNRFDTIAGIVKEISDINAEIASFSHEWSADAGRLKELETRHARMTKSAMSATKGKNADERAALAALAIEEHSPGLSEEIESLVGKVETHKTLFKTLERRASNAQSLLGEKRDERKFSQYVAPQYERPIGARS